MGIILKGLTWDHPRGYAPLLRGVPEYEGKNPEIKIQWDRRTLREFGEAPLSNIWIVTISSSWITRLLASPQLMVC